MNSKKYIRTKHTITNPNFFDIDIIFNDYITNHNKKNHLFLIKGDYKLIFNNDFSKPIHIETDFFHNTTPINLKTYLLYQIDNFVGNGHIFSHSDGMNISTISDKRYMTYEYYIEHPMQAIELKLNMIFAKNLQLINTLDRNKNHL